MKERIQTYLEERPRGAPSEDVAAEALSLSGAGAAVARSIVQAAVDGDSRFVCDADGCWHYRSGEGPKIVDAPLASVVSRTEGEGAYRRVIEVVAVTFTCGGTAEAYAPGGFGEGEMGSRYDALMAVVGSAVPVAFRLSGIGRSLERWRGSVGSRRRLPDGLCLFRMGRRHFPDAPMPDLEAVAEAIGMSYTTGRTLKQEALLQSELAVALLDRYAQRGFVTVEDVKRDLYPEKEPVDFDAFAFDEAYLDQLPSTPGIYMMRDRDGTVIYVGKSVNLHSRVKTYFVRREERAEKTKRILERIWSVEVKEMGSELEALLVEHRLINLCEPEFNTQTEVHPVAAERMAARNTILVLPSADEEGAELFCLRQGEITQVHVRRDSSNWLEVVRSLDELYYGDAGDAGDARAIGAPGTEVDDTAAAEMEIVRRWATQRKDQLNTVDVDGTSRDDVLRILREAITDCRPEEWERVWRV